MNTAPESMLMARTGRQHCLLTGTGTAAIYLALKAARLAPGSIVVLPNLLCMSPVLAVLWAGLRPAFVDVNEENYHLDPARLEALLVGGRVAAVIAAHLFGIPCPMERVQRLCRQHGVFLIEDCAQALGGQADARPMGSFGDAAIFSFGHGKTVEIGHGGAVACDDASLVARIGVLAAEFPAYDEEAQRRHRRLRRWLYFRIRSLTVLHRGAARLTGLFRYFPGYHLHAFDGGRRETLARVLAGLDDNLATRRRLMAAYREGIHNPHVEFSTTGEAAPTRVTVRTKRAEETATELRRRGIPANTLYPPLDGMFRNHLPQPGKLSVSRRLDGRLLNLWTSELTPAQVEETIAVLNYV